MHFLRLCGHVNEMMNYNMLQNNSKATDRDRERDLGTFSVTEVCKDIQWQRIYKRSIAAMPSS